MEWPHGADRYLETGEAITDAEFDDLRANYQAILLGALGDARVAGNEHARQILLGMRFKLDLYVNFRPVRLFHERLTPAARQGRGGRGLRHLPREHRGRVRGDGRHLQAGHARRGGRSRRT